MRSNKLPNPLQIFSICYRIGSNSFLFFSYIWSTFSFLGGFSPIPIPSIGSVPSLLINVLLHIHSHLHTHTHKPAYGVSAGSACWEFSSSLRRSLLRRHWLMSPHCTILPMEKARLQNTLTLVQQVLSCRSWLITTKAPLLSTAISWPRFPCSDIKASLIVLLEESLKEQSFQTEHPNKGLQSQDQNHFFFFLIYETCIQRTIQRNIQRTLKENIFSSYVSVDPT